jgi:hypothetical protein
VLRRCRKIVPGLPERRSDGSGTVVKCILMSKEVRRCGPSSLAKTIEIVVEVVI